jgi:hypothetical protein
MDIDNRGRTELQPATENTLMLLVLIAGYPAICSLKKPTHDHGPNETHFLTKWAAVPQLAIFENKV